MRPFRFRPHARLTTFYRRTFGESWLIPNALTISVTLPNRPDGDISPPALPAGNIEEM